MPEWLTPESRQLIQTGLEMTIGLTVLTSLFALALAISLCWLREYRWGRWFVVGYVEVFRNVPALVLIIFFAYALPNAFPLETRRQVFFQNEWMRTLREQTGVLIPYYAIATAIGLTLNTSAYLIELLRAGMKTLNPNHLAAARVLGAAPYQIFWRVRLPQSLRVASPAIITRLVHHLKNTALGSLVAVPELFKAIQASISKTFYASEFLLLAVFLYWVLSLGWAVLLRWVLPKPRSMLMG